MGNTQHTENVLFDLTIGLNIHIDYHAVGNINTAQ